MKRNQRMTSRSTWGIQRGNRLRNRMKITNCMWKICGTMDIVRKYWG
jgi:hypothetical protein